MSELEAGLIHDSLGYPEKLFQGGGGGKNKRKTDKQTDKWQVQNIKPQCLFPSVPQ